MWHEFDDDDDDDDDVVTATARDVEPEEVTQRHVYLNCRTPDYSITALGSNDIDSSLIIIRIVS